MRPRLLDLFAGAGGAARGYMAAGFHVTGVDIVDQPRYCGDEFVLADALDFAYGDWKPWDFAAVHASPPCPRYSERTPTAHKNGHPDLIDKTRELLEQTGLPWVIENVEGAPLRNPVRLCGTSFPGLRVIRHRLFETNWPLLVPPCGPHPLLYMPDRRRPHQALLDQHTAFVSVTGGGNCSVAAASSAMGIDWMTKDELNDAVPPAFTEHVGHQLLGHIATQGEGSTLGTPEPQESSA